MSRSRQMQDVRCTTPHLGKGARCALPLHPSGHGSFTGIEPVSEPAKRIAVPPLAGDFASPCTLRLEGVPAPKTPDHFMETTPARIGCRSCPSQPDTYDQTRAVWISVSVSPLNPDQGVILGCAP